MKITTQPLSGVKVIDFTQVMLGPIATQVLADYGADVIKIEKKEVGDLTRWSVTGDPSDINNPLFRSMNRNKRSLAIDLKAEDGRMVIEDLVRSADVVVNNFRAGVMDRLGFGYQRLCALNPRIIFASGVGFGRTGPLAHKGGQDVLAQAMSGVMARKSRSDDPLSIYATCLCDYTTGMHLVQAILLALLQRAKTGLGQEVGVSLFESMLAMQTQEAAMWLDRGEKLNWGAMPLTGTFATRDGALVMVGAFKTDPIGDIAKALSMPELAADVRFSTSSAQAQNKAELHSLFGNRFSMEKTAYWIGRLEEQDILCAPVLTMEEALEHEQTRVNGSIVLEPDGRKSLGTPLAMDREAFQMRFSPPKLGEHGSQVLRELDYSDDAIDRLKAAGTIA